MKRVESRLLGPSDIYDMVRERNMRKNIWQQHMYRYKENLARAQSLYFVIKMTDSGANVVASASLVRLPV